MGGPQHCGCLDIGRGTSRGAGVRAQGLVMVEVDRPVAEKGDPRGSGGTDRGG